MIFGVKEWEDVSFLARIQEWSNGYQLYNAHARKLRAIWREWRNAHAGRAPRSDNAYSNFNNSYYYYSSFAFNFHRVSAWTIILAFANKADLFYYSAIHHSEYRIMWHHYSAHTRTHAHYYKPRETSIVQHRAMAEEVAASAGKKVGMATLKTFSSPSINIVKTIPQGIIELSMRGAAIVSRTEQGSVIYCVL